MRITKLCSENFKRLKAVEITPDGNTVVIGGRNAQGKSSVLDSIMAALAGKKGAKEISRPIRDGETKASVVLELDDLRVERKWTASGSTVTVGPKDGSAKFNSPQAILDKLIGALAFDPLEFAEATPRDQVETLIDIVGRDAFNDVAEQRVLAYNARADFNREVKRLQAQLEPLLSVNAAGERVDVATLVEEDRIARRRLELHGQWTGLQDQIDDLLARQQRLVDEANKLPSTRDLAIISDELARADEINAQASKLERRHEIERELTDAEDGSALHDARIKACDEEKARLIREAALPIEGLAFDDDGVTYNGVPFTQASAAERLKVSVAMAMAMNPELRVICIRDASLLDDESRAALATMAEERDYQIWLEVVGDPGEVGVVIEDGMVQS